MASSLATLANDAENIDELIALPFPNTQRSVKEEITHNIATIGENMMLRRMKNIKVNKGAIVSYVHNATAEGMGRIGVLVALESRLENRHIKCLGKQIAMHVAATKPVSLSIEDLDPSIVQREREVLIEQAKQSGKPQEIAEKMVEGRIENSTKKLYYWSKLLLLMARVK